MHGEKQGSKGSVGQISYITDYSILSKNSFSNDFDFTYQLCEENKKN